MIPIVLLITIAVSTYDTKTQETKKLPAIISGGRIPTWISRIQTFIYSKKEDDNEKLYQINQAKIAIANGGWLGRGPGNSEQRNFLPHSYSDFIYAIIIEEYGLLGATVILFIYLVSMGGSSFLFTCMAIGIILSVARNVEQQEGKLQPVVVKTAEENKNTEEEAE